MRWVALPGDGAVRDPAIVPAEHGVAIGDLYFKSPTLRWEDGTHRLVFDHEGPSRAADPPRVRPAVQVCSPPGGVRSRTNYSGVRSAGGP